MSKPTIKEILVYKRELLLKSTAEDALDEREYLFSRTVKNKQGKVISEVQYDADENIVQHYEYNYDDNGFLLEEKLIEDDGMVMEHKSFEPDEKGNISKEFRHYMDGSFDTIHYHYDDNGLVSRKETIDPDGDTESVETFAYKEGLLSHYRMEDGEGELMAERKLKYDNNGKPVEVEHYDGAEGSASRKEIGYHPSGSKKETYTYNGDGKLIEKVELKENKEGQLVQVIEESLTKKNTVNFVYDSAGNIVQQEEFDRKGELISSVKREFDEHQNLISSDVFIHGAGRGVSRNYTLRQEYVFF